MKRTKKVSKPEWKKLTKRQKKQVKAAKKESWKCSGKKSSHGMRSSVAKTWDAKKGKVTKLKVVQTGNIPSERLDKMSERISESTGWSYDWIRCKKPSVILGLARKHL